MLKVSKLILVLLLGVGTALLLPLSRVMASSGREPVAAEKSPRKATLKSVAATAADIPFHEYDFQAEQRLLELANEARSQAEAAPLILDDGLSQAARTHAQAMFEARRLSHQFDGEPSLAQRLAAASHLLLDQNGENVALDVDVEGGHQHLMLSAPHRANLLNPAYNVVGLAVIPSGDRLYIVQDFGHALPRYSVTEVKGQIAAAVTQMRRQGGQPGLQRHDLVSVDDAACSMAQADKLGTSPIHQLAQRYTVLTFTSLHPEMLPGDASRAVNGRNLSSFSVGACYARTNTYPTGVYWIVLSLD
jgi:uncharacterized protein YkwD